MHFRHIEFGDFPPLVDLYDLDHFPFAATLLLLGNDSKEGLQFAIRRECDVLDFGGRFSDRRAGLDGERLVAERESLREGTLCLRGEGLLRVDEVHAVADLSVTRVVSRRASPSRAPRPRL